MWHSGQASTTNFPHVILFTKGDDSAKSDTVRCFWRTCLWPFSSIANSSFYRINPGFKHFFGNGFWPNCVSPCCVRRVSLMVPKLLDSWSTSIRQTWLQGLYALTLFLISKCWILPRPINPIWNRGPQWKCCCYLEVFSWTLSFISNKKGAGSSKILNLFIHAPCLKRDDVRWYFPGFCGVSEPTMWHSRQVSATSLPHVSLFTKGDDSAKKVPVPCCFCQTWFWPFRSIATSIFDRICRGSKHFLEAAVGQIVFLSVLFVLFHSRYLSTLIPLLISIRPMWLQVLYPPTLFLRSKCWILPMPIHPMWNLGPQW